MLTWYTLAISATTIFLSSGRVGALRLRPASRSRSLLEQDLSCGAVWSQQGVAIESERPGDGAGASVSLSSDGLVLAIGATGNDDAAPGAGHVRVFRRTDPTKWIWTQMGQDLDGDAIGDQAGIAVSVSSDGLTVAMSAFLHDGDTGIDSGLVRLFSYNSTVNRWTQLGQDLTGEAAGDHTGVSVGLSGSGDTVIVGAWEHDGNGKNSGHARIFRLVNNTFWVQLGEDIRGEAPNDRAGNAVALSEDGNKVVVAAATSAGGVVSNGSVRIFQWNATSNSWVQVGSQINGESPGDTSGGSVAMSAEGTTVAIGAGNNDANGKSSGHVRIYHYSDGSDWKQLGGDLDGAAAGDFFGLPVSLSADGRTVAVGGTENDGNGDNSGHVRVFKYMARIGWFQIGDDLYGEGPEDQFGSSVSLSRSGDILAVGAPFNPGQGGFMNGNVRVFSFPSDPLWEQVGSDISGEAEGDASGFAVSLSSSGNIVAIGAVFNGGSGEKSGHVRVYGVGPELEWKQMGNDIDGEAANDLFGFTVSLSSDGMTLAIGATQNEGPAGKLQGHVRVYTYNVTSADWIQLGNDIDGEAAGDLFGYSVSISSDGRTVAAGATGNDGGATKGGHVRVYNYSNETGWTQQGSDIDGEFAGDEFGFAVSLAEDGRTVAIGAPFNGGNGFDTGYVRVFRYNDALGWTPLGSSLNGTAAGDLFGWIVSLSADGSTVAIGGSEHDTAFVNSGHVRILSYNEGEWVQLGDDIKGELPRDELGTSVALSSDGRTVAIGAPFDNDNTGDNRGKALVYKYSRGSGWTQLGETLVGDAGGDRFGFFVALNSDGTSLAVSAHRNSNLTGLVKVFDFSEPRDITPPNITCKNDIEMNADTPEGSVVSFDVSAIDNCDSKPTVVCEPRSGTLFSVGNTTVTCRATDASKYENICTFSVIVVSPETPVPSGAPASPGGPPQGTASEGGLSTGKVAGTVGAVAFIAILLVLLLVARFRKEQERGAEEGEAVSMQNSQHNLLEQLEHADRLAQQYDNLVECSAEELRTLLLDVAAVMANINEYRIELAGGVGQQISKLPDDQHVKLTGIVDFGIKVATSIMDKVDEAASYDVFVSFPGEERFWYVSQLVDELRKIHLEIFYDQEEMRAGRTADGEKMMIESILTATVVVCVCTVDAVRKKWPIAELLCALARNDEAVRNALDRTPLVADAVPGEKWRERTQRHPKFWVDDLKELIPTKSTPSFQDCELTTGRKHVEDVVKRTVESLRNAGVRVDFNESSPLS